MPGLDKGYGVLRARPVRGMTERDADAPHYQILAMAEGQSWRIAVNVRSRTRPAALLYAVVEDFRYPHASELLALKEGYTKLDPAAGGLAAGRLAIDYIRANLFAPHSMRMLTHDAPGADDDLNDLLHFHLERTVADPDGAVFVFGEPWGPERGQDAIFRFKPGRGMHNVHMNQGNMPPYERENGVWQDGALLFRQPATGLLTAVFLAFQDQGWHTNDTTGKPVEGSTGFEPGAPGSPAVRIVGVRMRPFGQLRAGALLVNAAGEAVDVNGWQLAFGKVGRTGLSGVLEPAATRFVPAPPRQIERAHGLVTLLDATGLKVHGVPARTVRSADGSLELF
ncbi:MAG TPA: YukJ family protein [Arenibaculum sp.]|nr:YukJ family protein [Arenibaculum sp.]